MHCSTRIMGLGLAVFTTVAMGKSRSTLDCEWDTGRKPTKKVAALKVVRLQTFAKGKLTEQQFFIQAILKPVGKIASPSIEYPSESISGDEDYTEYTVKATAGETRAIGVQAMYIDDDFGGATLINNGGSSFAHCSPSEKPKRETPNQATLVLQYDAPTKAALIKAGYLKAKRFKNNQLIITAFTGQSVTRLDDEEYAPLGTCYKGAPADAAEILERMIANTDGNGDYYVEEGAKVTVGKKGNDRDVLIADFALIDESERPTPHQIKVPQCAAL